MLQAWWIIQVFHYPIALNVLARVLAPSVWATGRPLELTTANIFKSRTLCRLKSQTGLIFCSSCASTIGVSSHLSPECECRILFVLYRRIKPVQLCWVLAAVLDFRNPSYPWLFFLEYFLLYRTASHRCNTPVQRTDTWIVSLILDHYKDDTATISCRNCCLKFYNQAVWRRKDNKGELKAKRQSKILIPKGTKKETPKRR